MESPVNVMKGMFCGLVFLAGVAWQIRIYQTASESYRGWEELVLAFLKNPRRFGNASRSTLADRARLMTFALPFTASWVVVALALVGVVAYGLLASIDPQREVSFVPLARFFVAVVIIAAAFLVKSLLNAVLLSATVTWTLYKLLLHGEFSFIPLYSILFELVSEGLPLWIPGLYTLLSLGYAVVSAVSSSFERALSALFLED